MPQNVLRLSCLALAVAAFLVGATAPSAHAAAASATIRPLPPSVLEFEQLADRLVAEQRVSGLATAVVKNGQVLSLHGVGLADATSGRGVDEHTAFRLASASKAFASALAGLLVADGFLGWGDRVQDLVPAFELSDPHASTQVTLLDLLSHRTGLPHNSLDHLLEQGDAYPLIVYKLRQVEMACAVGDCYGYQNIAYGLFSDVAFAATGDFYEHQVSRRIFTPLGMSDASFGRDGLQSTADFALPHDRRGRGWQAFQPNDNYYRVPAAAGVNASASDLGQWLLAQLGHRPDVLSPELLATVHTPLVSTPTERTTAPWRRERLQAANYALGWRVFDYAGHTLIFHGGAVRGYRSIVAMLPELDLGVAIVWNCESAAPSGMLPTLLDRELGLPTVDWVGSVYVPKAKAKTPAAPAPRTTPRRRKR